MQETSLPTLSLVVITKNEEDAIERCLRSVPFVTDIIVVDSGSTDRTVEIAKSCGAKVTVTSDWPGFGPQKTRALSQASGDWVLALDADEWISPEYLDRLKAAISVANPPAAYRTGLRSRFCGKIVKFSGWSPDYTVRIFRRSQGRFSNKLVHEGVVVDGEIRPLAIRIDHDPIVSWAEAEDKIERYSRAAAQQMAARGQRASRIQGFIHGWAAFIKTFVLRGGFLDGETGYGVGEYNRRYAYAKWRRLWQLTRARR